jgi:peptidoglycan/LPS O-acetylase OafA/YrhL
VVETRFAALQAGRRLPELDGLRGLAVTLVVFLHTVVRCYSAHAFVATWPAWVRRLADMSWCGVDLFFVLSGFLIGGILLDHRASPGLLKAFYARRVARIFPAYFLLIGLALASLGIPPNGVRGTVPLAAYVFFLQNFWTSAGAASSFWLGPCWSIAIEEQFYLIAPTAISRVSDRALLKLLAIATVGPLALRCVALFSPGLLDWMPFRISAWDFTLCRTDGLALGIFGAWATRKPHLRDRLLCARGQLMAGLATLLGAIFLLSQSIAYPWGDALQESIGLSVLAVAALLLVLLCVLFPDTFVARVFRVPFLTDIGARSYFIYLFHMPVLEYVTRERRPYLTNWLLAMGTLTFLTTLSWRFLEKPFLRLGHRVAYESALPGSAGQREPDTSQGFG